MVEGELTEIDEWKVFECVVLGRRDGSRSGEVIVYLGFVSYF